jgi:paraquat-inducible protein B
MARKAARGTSNLSEQAEVKQSQTLSRVWLIPLVAVIIGAWMVYSQWLNQGTLITIELPAAAGIEANRR